MDIQELRKKDLGDLQKLLSDKRKEQITISFDLKMGKIKNVKTLANLKQDISQILTVINQQTKQNYEKTT